MKILGTGSRDWKDRRLIEDVFECFTGTIPERPPTYIHGGQRGFDIMSGQVAEARGWIVRAYPMLPGEIGSLRNSRMLREEMKLGDIDLGLAFPLPPSSGTWDMVRKLKARRIPVLVEVGYRF